MRERAFAVLGDRVSNARILDLYAGTGAVGLEALSRGARSVVFVERHRAAADLVEKNSRAFELGSDRAELMVRRAMVAAGELARRGVIFDIVWADPPFEAWNEGLEVIAKLFWDGVLVTGSLACLECPSRADVAGTLPPGLEIVRDLTGSASRVVMIEKVASDPL